MPARACSNTYPLCGEEGEGHAVVVEVAHQVGPPQGQHAAQDALVDVVAQQVARVVVREQLFHQHCEGPERVFLLEVLQQQQRDEVHPLAVPHAGVAAAVGHEERLQVLQHGRGHPPAWEGIDARPVHVLVHLEHERVALGVGALQRPLP